MKSYNNIDQILKKSIQLIKSKVTIVPQTGVILGSGLGAFTEELEHPSRIGFNEIPGFPVSTVSGHIGEFVIGIFEGKNIIAVSGRIHYYEGYSMQEITLPVKVLCSLGIKNLIVTNAGGAANVEFEPGDIMLISDHINFMGDNPLIGAANFIDMTNVYDSDLRAIAKESSKQANVVLKEGVYLALSGPNYETPAEVRMFKNNGADVIGMSTVPEVIVARSLGVRIVGFSMITNMAAGITGKPLSHEEVIDTSNRTKEKFKAIIKEVIKRI